MDRKQKYALIKKTTGNSKLAQKARDWNMERIDKEILSMYKPTTEVLIKRQMRSDTIRHKRTVIRKAGYSPVEANRMVSWSWKHINETINNKIIINKKARRERWKSMSRRRLLDPEFEVLARSLNKRKNEEIKKENIKRVRIGMKPLHLIDEDHSFGWSIAYYVYTEGVDPDKWFKSVKIDPFIPEVYRLPNTVSF